jgi:predicted NBD/HSP70 family sugar kinase
VAARRRTSKRSPALAERSRRQFERELAEHAPFASHGAELLDGVRVSSYNLELRERGTFVGDRGSKSAFIERLEEMRSAAREHGPDPLGRTKSENLSRRDIVRLIERGPRSARRLVRAAIDEQAHALADVVGLFRRHSVWRGIRRIFVGGGFSEGKLGALIVSQTRRVLRRRGTRVSIVPTTARKADHAGLVGAVHLVAPWMLGRFDAILAVDLGGRNVRCGIVTFAARGGRVRHVRVVAMERWCHADTEASRDDIVDWIVAMLRRLAREAERKGRKLAPLVGIGCPGRIGCDGHVEAGAQNLPGRWQQRGFRLSSRIRDGLGTIGGHVPVVIMHNDAVLQGLGELPHLRGARVWGVLTIGTGLGNATFERRHA